MAKVLHLLAQRPSLTGSGITLDALVRHAARAGWEQCVACGVPAEDPQPEVGGLASDRIFPLVFGRGELTFPVPGMSDVMPYPSSRFSRLSQEQILRYRAAWKGQIEKVLTCFKPDLIHAHHLWIMSSLVKDVAPQIPLMIHCHATGLRQMALCPDLAETVRRGCSRADRILVLHKDHADRVRRELGMPEWRVPIVGSGYGDELFHARHRREADSKEKHLLYVGKYSSAKGLPWLLDAVERVAEVHPGLMLHVAGDGAGPEAEALRARMAGMHPLVKMHGQLSQPELAERMRYCSVCVLPSLYEGVPLVLAEALACGCRLVATRLPGVLDPLAVHLGSAMNLVELPGLQGVDTPLPEDLPAFVDDLIGAIEAALAKPALGDPMETMPGALEPFQWSAVFRRVEQVWSTFV
ncbi:MAG: glycosyltransferase family 4 protein [Planctomycetota bacterium]